MGLESEKEEAVNQAIGILDQAKEKPYQQTDEDKAVAEVQDIIGNSKPESLININQPEYQRLEKIYTKLATVQKQLEQKHIGEEKYEEVVREEYVEPRAEEKIPSQKVKLVLGKNADGKTYMRTELFNFVVTDILSLKESVQITDQGNKMFRTEKYELVTNVNNQKHSQPLMVKSNESAKAIVDTFYKHTETIVPPTPIIEQGKKFMRRIFKR